MRASSGATTQKRKIGQRDLWDVIVNNDEISFKHILPRLNATDIKFLYEVNAETRAFIQRSSRRDELEEEFRIEEMSSVSTLEFAWENRSLWPECWDETWFCFRVAKTNKLELLKWIREEKSCKWDDGTTVAAACQGNLEMVKYCVANKCPVNDWACALAAENGHLECLKHLHEEVKVPWDWGTAACAAKNGHLHILEYLVERKYDKYLKNACEFAAAKGHLDCLKYLHETAKAPWDSDVALYAYDLNKPQCLQYLLDNDCPLPEGWRYETLLMPRDLWDVIVNNDDICFEHILPKLNVSDVKFLYGVNTETRALIKRSSRKDDLKKGFKVEEMSSILTLEIWWENESLPTCVDERDFCWRVAQRNQLELLKWAREEKECDWDHRTIDSAACQGNLEMVKYCVANMCDISLTTCACAAKFGHLECLKYLHEEVDAPLYLIAKWAAENGHLHILEYLFEQKKKRKYKASYQEDGMAYISAAMKGHLDCLKYLHEVFKARWNSNAVQEAHKNDKHECLQYLLDNNCPLPEGWRYEHGELHVPSEHISSSSSSS